jgi:dTDP-4-dehydrorhamnose 3,5-epimerase-like enzyme
MTANAQLIKGNRFSDERGTISFVNDFDLRLIRRFYTIVPNDTNTIRAWQGHKLEQKWFFCTKGAFSLNLVQPNNWDAPTGQELVQHFTLTDQIPSVLHITGGFVTGIKANEAGSILTVFSDVDLALSKADDYRFRPETWAFQTDIEV